MTVNGSKYPPNNLFTNEGLTASFKDLEQILDHSDDASSDETAVSSSCSILLAYFCLMKCLKFKSKFEYCGSEF